MSVGSDSPATRAAGSSGRMDACSTPMSHPKTALIPAQAFERQQAPSGYTCEAASEPPINAANDALTALRARQKKAAKSTEFSSSGDALWAPLLRRCAPLAVSMVMRRTSSSGDPCGRAHRNQQAPLAHNEMNGLLNAAPHDAVKCLRRRRRPLQHQDLPLQFPQRLVDKLAVSNDAARFTARCRR